MVEKNDSPLDEEGNDQLVAEKPANGDDADGTESDAVAESQLSEDSGAESAAQEADSIDEVAADQGDAAAQIEALTEQLAQAKDQSLRTQAEMQNLRRRVERDVENAHKFGLEKLINGLLPVLDNLDRAISSVDDEAKADTAVASLLEGVELTRKSAADVLKNFAVEVLEPFGEPFDPQFHEAMTMIPSETAEPNSVVDVLQKGYTLNGRLIRAAMVVVAKA